MIASHYCITRLFGWLRQWRHLRLSRNGLYLSNCVNCIALVVDEIPCMTRAA
jgi:hypothetical protein